VAERYGRIYGFYQFEAETKGNFEVEGKTILKG
jgi:hypothetical protein